MESTNVRLIEIADTLKISKRHFGHIAHEIWECASSVKGALSGVHNRPNHGVTNQSKPFIHRISGPQHLFPFPKQDNERWKEVCRTEVYFEAKTLSAIKKVSKGWKIAVIGVLDIVVIE